MCFLVKFLYYIDFSQKLYDNICTHKKERCDKVFYENELNFFRSFIESYKIRTTLITENIIHTDIDLGIRKLLGIEADYKKTFNLSVTDNATVSIIQDIFNCNYIFIPLPHLKEKTVLVAGPYITEIVSKAEIERETAHLSLSASTNKNIQKYFSVVPFIPDNRHIMTAVNCLCEIMFGSADAYKITTHHKDELNDISVLMTSKQEEENDSPLITIQMIEKAYEQENKLLNAISQGLVHKAEAFFTNGKPSDMLESRVTDRLRNAKNFLIVLNTLARKAVEQGGVHPIYIDSLSSDFAMRIEACKDTDECDDLFFKMIKQYSRLVQKHSQKGYSLFVQKVITCIDSDITADLSLKTQAKLLNVNPSYLSTLFKKETGVTLTDYVNQKRVERAKHLLKSGNIQIQAVAQSCGILDVNYFTKIFKKYAGTTPKEYRAK